jgi:hypothetical protein
MISVVMAAARSAPRSDPAKSHDLRLWRPLHNRKSWLFCGSDRGGQRAAVMYSLIVTAKMNDVDPQAWLADVLARIAEHPVQKLDDLLPWNWSAYARTIAPPQAA